ncbi:glycosyltransferase [Rhodococcus sp. T2V]|uniref:glycosyltransferase n=1 Tax=Rhodococcus sp. T2V TaxID=3034164 RepID=UPI0023E24CF3|nr:glycosyltransferase [Rhodococcus sp. T2V]MDF3311619.1 glycosyltransferase [Rhodococcus sp. T2V]
MARILFVTWDGGGNLPPALGIARELQKRGHSVRFLGHALQRSQIAPAGFPFEPYRHARPWQSTTEHRSATGLFASPSVFTDPGPGRDLLDSLNREPADLIVIDCLLLGALHAAQKAHLPRVVLVHTFCEFVERAMRSGPTQVLARLHGHHPLALWKASDLVLVATDKHLDPAGTRRLHPAIHHIGAVHHPMPATLTPVSYREPQILVSLSINNLPGQHRALQSILDALRGINAHTVVTTGPSITSTSLTTGPNTEIHGYRPHSTVLPKTTLVIGHGGHDTTLRTLTHDIPMIVMPIHPLADQNMIGRTIENHGAAQCLHPTTHPDRMVADGQWRWCDPRGRRRPPHRRPPPHRRRQPRQADPRPQRLHSGNRPHRKAPIPSQACRRNTEPDEGSKPVMALGADRTESLKSARPASIGGRYRRPTSRPAGGSTRLVRFRATQPPRFATCVAIGAIDMSTTPNKFGPPVEMHP